MNSTFLDFSVLSGIILSFFLVVLIFSSTSFRNDVHVYFGVTILSLNLALLTAYFPNHIPSNGILELVSWDFLFPFAFLLYSLKAIKHPLSENKTIWLLILPTLLISFANIIDFIFDFDVWAWLSQDDDELLNTIIEVRTFLFMPFSIVIIGFTFFKVRKANNLLKSEKQWLEINSILWLSFIGLWWLSDSIVLIIDLPIWEYLLALLSYFLIVITYLGIHHLNISEQRRQINKIKESQRIQETKNKEEEIVQNLKKSNQNSQNSNTPVISPKALEKIEKLHLLMIEENLYQDASLTRSRVADKLGISEGYLSELLKTVLNTNFNDYVNEFRVNYSIQMFKDKNFDLFSIEAIGGEAGFKTKSVFYTAFKKVTKKTPGSYRKTINLS